MKKKIRWGKWWLNNTSTKSNRLCIKLYFNSIQSLLHSYLCPFRFVLNKLATKKLRIIQMRDCCWILLHFFVLFCFSLFVNYFGAQTKHNYRHKFFCCRCWRFSFSTKRANPYGQIINIVIYFNNFFCTLGTHWKKKLNWHVDKATTKIINIVVNSKCV